MSDMGEQYIVILADILENMALQFGYRAVKDNKPVIHTGGLRALEDAFESLGWDDPHYLPEEGSTCEVKGCMEPDTVGTPWGDDGPYLRLCSEHGTQAAFAETMPEIKQYALDRESRRDPITRRLREVENEAQ